MNQHEKEMLEEYHEAAENFKNLCYLLFVAGIVFGTIGTLIFINW